MNSTESNSLVRTASCPFRIKMLHSSETHVCTSQEPLGAGDLVVIHSKYGSDIGKVLGPVCSGSQNETDQIQPIVRKATQRDKEIYEKNRAKESEAMSLCQEKIKAHNLEMKLVSAHYLDDETKVLFFFTAESRIDFRELVKDLVSVFKMRIELRQIGVRDEARVLGGVAVCGRIYCCHGLTDHLNPVSIKMAKEQNLSLNSLKISGPCGRLLCCLAYECDFYREEKSKWPQEGSRLRVGDIQYKVNEVNILSKTAKLTGNDGSSCEIPLDKFSYESDKGRWTITDFKRDT